MDVISVRSLAANLFVRRHIYTLFHRHRQVQIIRLALLDAETKIIYGRIVVVEVLLKYKRSC